MEVWNMKSPNTDLLLQEMKAPPIGVYAPHVYRAEGINAHPDAPHGIRRAHSVATLLASPKAFIYKGDTIVGSIRPLWAEVSPEENQAAATVCAPFGIRGFHHNGDHFAPDYATFLKDGIPGTLARI
jgi:hypothetical protein